MRPGRWTVKPHHYAVPYIETLLATFLLTGGRKSEVFGLLVSDIDFDNQCVHFHPNRYRRFKTDTSERDVPLWDELAALLVLHVANRSPTELLFRSREWWGIAGSSRQSGAGTYQCQDH